MSAHAPLAPVTPTAPGAPPASLRYKFLGMDFASPIVLLSGCVGFGEEYTRVEGFSNADCGAVVLKGTTLEARLGNSPHRIYETAMGMLNAIGLQNPGTDGFAVINTVMGMAIDSKTRRPVIGNIQGGLSGPAIKPIALLKVHQVYDVAKKHGVPIIGQGGIINATDAIEFMIAGASAVGVGTSLFYDPHACRKINAGIDTYLTQHNFTNVTELVGTLQTGC